MRDFPPVYAITSDSLIRYYEYPPRREKLLKSENSIANLKREKLNGFMSNSTRRGLQKKLCIYFDSVKELGYKFRKANNICHAIVTLTLPSVQEHPDNVIKRECLMRFIELMKAKYSISFFYWVAEKQKNENIHFHILIDRFVDWQWVRKAWNARLEHLGYIDRFEQKHQHRDPNSTDIQMIKNIAKSAEYVTKYTTKLKQQGGIEGRLHGESDKLREVCKLKMYGSHEFDMKISEWMERSDIESFPHEHCLAVYGSIRNLIKKECPKTYVSYVAHCTAIASLFY